MRFDFHTFRKYLKEGLEHQSFDSAVDLLKNEDDNIRNLMNYINEYVDEYESIFTYPNDQIENNDDKIYIYILTRTQIIRYIMDTDEDDCTIESFLISDIRKVTMENCGDFEGTIDFGFEKIFIKCICNYGDMKKFFKRIIQLR